MAGREIYGANHKGSGPKKERTIPRIAVDMKVKAGGIGNGITMGGHLYQMEKHGPLAMASQSEAMALLRKRVEKTGWRSLLETLGQGRCKRVTNI